MGTKQNFKTFILEFIIDAVIIFGLVFGIIRPFVIAPYHVHGTSMCDTLNAYDGFCNPGFGEYLIINKIGYLLGTPQRGDIVVLEPPGLEPGSAEEFFIKRIIGLPGETVELRDGEVFISNSDRPNGFKLNEPYLNEENRGHTQPSIPGKTKFVVPSGKYFVMGDNRRVSSDSRSCFRSIYAEGCITGDNAFVTKNRLEGKAWLILWPLKVMGTAKTPTYAIK